MHTCRTLSVFLSIMVLICTTSLDVQASGDGIRIDENSFPDESFRDFIMQYDTNSDGYLSDNERLSVDSMTLSGEDITIQCQDGDFYFPGMNNCHSIEGIESFSNLRKLNILGRFKCNSIDLSGLHNLKYLYVEEYNEGPLIVNTEIEYLKLLFLDDLSMVKCTSLEHLIYLDVEGCYGEAFSDFTGCKKLETAFLSYEGNERHNFNFTNCSKLRYLDIKGLDSIVLDGCTSLEYLSLSGHDNQSTDYKLGISDCTKLQYLEVHGELSTLDLSSNTELKTLIANYVPEIDITENSYLLETYNCGQISDKDSRQNHLQKYKHAFQEYSIEYDDWFWTPVSEVENRAFTSSDYYLCLDKDTRIISKKSTPTPTPTSKPVPTNSPSTNNTTAGDTPLESFVERLYSVALGRQSDPRGKSDWVNLAMNGTTGADIAVGFLYSQEFLEKQMSNDEFLDVLYRVFFDREPDAEGKAFWLQMMNNGASKLVVIDGFINSIEWANVCLRFGIYSGSQAQPNIVIEPSNDVIEFVTRLYDCCLGREPEAYGLSDWSHALSNLRISGTVAARGFFFSDEFLDANHSDSEYVTRLYRTFMGREPDQGGYTYWMNQLSSGVSRENVFYGFAYSSEFGELCAKYGIIR